MRFYTAIATSKESPTDFIVFAATYLKDYDPNFSIRNLDLRFLYDTLTTVIIIHGKELVPSVNAACNRTLERLLLQKQIIPGNPPDVELLVDKPLAKHMFVLPHRVKPRYWLTTVAKNGLKSWLEGDRP